ncbi:mechanosensitive ion channel family protein [Maridesulfovibrio hydrothermalis]|uniref:Small-conductance mechanosensitive channel n=1 Tax=Maridesulfovibrio hydrothermalis AM13 = DSM 14728 TaxID=1121451 RepID=L0RGP2_9BACT|nr:mechanosensitive ion channel domain-containing protein [Maridesulfovibrio hydrothermalis]CCO24756.1 Small-conductance mechanosensitive channel [Maridesulfovibrio hydrothermalis AM13 = DSM 14728]
MNGTEKTVETVVSGIQLDLMNPDFMSNLANDAIAFISLHGLRIIVAILVLYAGRFVSRQLSNVVGRLMAKSKVDEILTSFIKAIIYYTVLAAVVVAALGQAGINVTSFLAVLGAAGLAVGLALKDTLSNFAAGVMLILLRLFKKGDLVTVAGTSGIVQELSAFYTELSTLDNQRVVIPNSSILQSVIINTTAHKSRRIDLVIGIGYDDDIQKAKALIHEILSDDSRLLKNPAPAVMVGELGASSVDILVRPWVSTSEYFATKCDLLEKIKIAFDGAGISIPYPQSDVHLYKEGED